MSKNKKDIKSAMEDVMKTHAQVFKRLAPRDMSYSFEFNDIIVLSEVIVLLHVYFGNDYEKITAWLTFENLNFGGTTAIKLIQAGKGNKVISFIKTSLDENGL